MCPREKMIFDEANSCITYVCDGNFQLPTRIGQQRTQDIQENIEQGIAFDATATGLEVIGTCLEFLILPLFMI